MQSPVIRSLTLPQKTPAQSHGVVVEKTGMNDPKELAAWYLECLKLYLQKIRQIDPQIPVILDGLMGDDIEQTVLADPFIRAKLAATRPWPYTPAYSPDFAFRG